MSAAAGLREFAASDGVVQVCLGLDGAQMTSLQPVSGWARGETSNHASIQFGPFPASVEADSVLVFINQQGPDEVRLDGTLRLPPGMPFLFDLSLAVI